MLPDRCADMLYLLQNLCARVAVTDYGARLVSVETPDRAGAFGHILLGFDDPETYRQAAGSFGAVLGRYANRIANAEFRLDGAIYRLKANDHGNILHGGESGFGNRSWQMVSSRQGERSQVAFSLVSPDGEEGFPGTLTARAIYTLEADRLSLDLYASTDMPTVVNLSSHPYFNLGNVAREDVLDHEITVNAGHYLPTDARQIPTGEICPVEGTVFDFRTRKRFDERIRNTDPQLLIACGYDHCFVLNKTGQGAPEFAARAYAPGSGRMLEIYTTQPGLQLYSGNNLTGAIAGRGGVALRQSAGFAMEAQNFPNAPNQPNFPSAVLRPGEEYRHTIIYKFAAR